MTGTSLGDLIVSLGIDPSGLAAGAGEIESRLATLGNRMFFLGSRIGAAFSVPLAGVVATIATLGGEFDQAMTESIAIMDRITPEIRAKMEEQATIISTTTKFSATEAAKAYYDLASAGLNAADAINALPVVAAFAQAGMMDLAKAGEWLAGSQAALGLKTDNASQNLVEMTRISDVLTQVNNKSIGTVKDYAQALTNNGAVAMRTYGMSLENGVAVLGVFGQQHILGNRAGTLLNVTLRDLTAAAIKHAQAFKDAGIAVFDANGRLRNMADISDDLTKKLGPMATEGRRAELMALGLTARSMQGTLALVGMGDAIRSLEHDLHNAGGTTQEVAEKQMQSFNNQMLVIEHSFQNVAIQIFTQFVPAFNDYIVPAINKALGVLQEFADWLGTLDEKTKAYIITVAALGIAIGPVLLAFSGIVLLGQVATTIASFGASFFALGQTAGIAAIDLAEVGTAAEAAEASLAVAGGIAVGTAALWGGLVIAVGAVTYGLKEMVGGWGRLFNVLNVFTGNVLYILVDGFEGLWNSITSHTGVLSDLYEVVHAKVYQAFDGLKDLLNRLADDGGVMIQRWDSVKTMFYNITAPINAVGIALSNVNDFMRDHLPLVASVEDWTKNKLSSALEWAKSKYDGIVQSAKDYNATLDLALPKIKSNTDAYWRMSDGMSKVHEWILKNQPAQLPIAAPLPGGVDMNTFLNQWLGPQSAPAPGPGKKTSARTTSIFEDITGEKAMKDANDWLHAIDLIGGASQVAESDINKAVRVFDDVIDRMERAGNGGTAAAQAFYDMRDQLFWSSSNGQKLADKLDAVQEKGKTIAQLTASNDMLPYSKPGATENIDTYLKSYTGLVDIEQKGKSISQLSPNMFPGFIPASAIQRSLQMTSILPGLSKMFNDLGRSIGGVAGTVIESFGKAVAVMADADKATQQLGLNGQKLGGSFGYMSVALNENATTAERTQAVMASLTAVVGGAKAVWDATSASASAAGNAMNGAMKGAEAGAAFGPWGMAIGAAAGFFVGLVRGKPEWAQAADDIGTEFGVKISDKLSHTIADAAKTDFGGSLQASEIGHLKDIIGEAGGLSAGNLSTMEDRLHDVFSMIETHQMTIAQGAKTINDNFADFAKAGTDSLGFLDQKLQGIIKLDAQFGTQSSAIATYITGQVSTAVTGFNSIVTGALSGMNALNDASKDSTKTDVERAKAQTDLTAALVGGQDEFDRLGRLAQVSFGAALASGKTFLQAIDLIGPSLDTMTTAATNFGFQQSDAFQKLSGIRTFTQANKDLIGELDGVNQMMTGLTNSGMMTNQTFNDLGDEAASVFDRMQKKGLDTNTSLLMMQPTLQTLWEGEQTYGFKADDTTQALIDQGVQAGIVGETHKSLNQQMVDGVNKVNDTLKTLVDFLTHNATGAWDTLASKSSTVIGDMKSGLNDISKTDISFDVHGRFSVDGEVDAPRMASGGILTGPRTVYAGEAGPEAIIPISKLKDYLQPGAPSQSGDVVIQIDGREIARTSLQYMPNELRRNGIFT